MSYSLFAASGAHQALHRPARVVHLGHVAPRVRPQWQASHRSGCAPWEYLSAIHQATTLQTRQKAKTCLPVLGGEVLYASVPVSLPAPLFFLPPDLFQDRFPSTLAEAC